MVSKDTTAIKYAPLSIGVGLAGMWLLGTVGVFLLHHFNPHHFVLIDQVEEAERNHLILQHYMLQLIVQAPAIYWAAQWFRSAAIPTTGYRAFIAVSALHITLLALRSFNWSWSSFASVNQFVPLAAELIYILTIAVITALFTYIPGPRRTLAQAEIQA